MLPREIDLNEWLASNSEYCDRTALRLLPTPKKALVHWFFLLISVLRKTRNDYLCVLHNACHYTLHSN